MKTRMKLEVDGWGQRVQTDETPKRVHVRLELTVESVRGEPVVGTVEQVMRRSAEIAAQTLDRRPY